MPGNELLVAKNNASSSLKYAFTPVFISVGLNVSYSVFPFKNLPIFVKTVFHIDGIIVSSAASIS